MASALRGNDHPRHVKLNLPVDKWESIAERKIREAIESGEFDNLPDRGKPIALDRDPFEDPSMWMAHHLLRVNGFAPPWIEEARDIDRAAAHLRASFRDATPGSIAEFRTRGAELNRRILTYNLKCPAARFHKLPVDLDAEVEAIKAWAAGDGRERSRR